jgi:hypothetical protein
VDLVVIGRFADRGAGAVSKFRQGSPENVQASDLGIHVSLVCESPLFTGEESRDPHPGRAA